MSPRRLTLTMIVKNEAELLPRFLQSVHGLADEFIVVDTGSTDQTVELLQHAGARVIHRPWDHDFSAARNAGLEEATGDWVLFLDPDEFVSPELVSQIRSLLSDERCGAATVRMVNQMPHGHRRETQLLRLFRRDPSIRFRYAIHEDVTEAVNAMLRREKLEWAHLSGQVEHVGYVRERASARNKKERDLGILQACLDRDPEDFYAHFKVLEQARFWNDRALWRLAAQRAADALRLAGRRVLCHAYYGGELVALISQGLGVGAGDSLKYLDGFEGQLVPSAAFHLRRGELCELTGDFSRAEKEFRRCLEQSQHFGNRQLATVRPLLGLARIRIAQGKLADGAEFVEQALTWTPKDPEGLLAGAVLARAVGGKDGLERWAQRRLTQDGDSTELQQALGEEALNAQEPTRAVAHFEQAAAHDGEGPLAVRLAQAYLASGSFDSAYQLTHRLSSTQPEAALGLVVLNLLLGRDTAIEVDLEQAQADAVLRAWVDAIVMSQSGPLIERLRQFGPALCGPFPWLHRVLEGLIRLSPAHAAAAP